MDAHHRGSSGHGLEPRQARGDGRRVAPELDGDRRIHRADRVDGEVELAMRIPAPGLQLVVGGLAGSEIRGIGRRRRERGVKPRHQRPEVLRDVRRPVHRHAARRRDEAGEELRRPLRDVVGTGDVRLEHRQRGDAAVAGHGLRPAGETWNTGEPCLLGEKGGQLQVRVEARLDASVRLEQHAVADHGDRVRIVAAERRLGRRSDLVGRPLPDVREPGRRPADQRRVHLSAARARSRRRAVPGHRRDRAAARDRSGQRPPGAVTIGRLAHDAVPEHEGDRVPVDPLAGLAGLHVHEGERNVRGEGEGVGEASGRGSAGSRRVPPARAEVRQVEVADRPQDGRDVQRTRVGLDGIDHWSSVRAGGGLVPVIRLPVPIVHDLPSGPCASRREGTRPGSVGTSRSATMTVDTHLRDGHDSSCWRPLGPHRRSGGSAHTRCHS